MGRGTPTQRLESWWIGEQQQERCSRETLAAPGEQPNPGRMVGRGEVRACFCFREQEACCLPFSLFVGATCPAHPHLIYLIYIHASREELSGFLAMPRAHRRNRGGRGDAARNGGGSTAGEVAARYVVLSVLRTRGRTHPAKLPTTGLGQLAVAAVLYQQQQQQQR